MAISEKTLISKCLGETVKVGVVVSYNSCRNILILLHGYDAMYDDLYDNLPLQEYADKYQLLIVCPNMGNGFYIDHPDRKRFVGEFLAKELPAYIETQYELEKDAGVILAGISMGGYGAMLTACHFPECFTNIIAISGAYIAESVSIGDYQVVGSPNNHETVKYFLETFGPDVSDLDTSIERNPLAALDLLISNEQRPFFYLTCGTEDILFERNLEMVRKMKERRIPYEWQAIAGDHMYKCFKRGIRAALDKCCGG